MISVINSTTSSNTWETIPSARIYSPHRNEDIYVWKKVFVIVFGRCGDLHTFPVIAKLRIPKDAGIVSGPLKCRASRAIVEGFYADDHEWAPSPDNELSLTKAHSAVDPDFLYEKGKEVVPDSFDPDPTTICSHGINFFRTYEEAAVYDFM